jgi:hypothetical protein
MSTSRGALKRAILVRTWAISSSGVVLWPGRSTTNAFGRSPYFSSGTPMTAASRTAGPPTPTDPDKWLETATVENGSWWRPWTEWLIARSGPEKATRATLGNRQYRPLAPAPGTYVFE